MAACGCPGCGGREQWLREQAEAQEQRRLAFEAWYNDPANAETVARIKAEAKATTEADKAKVPA